MSSFNRGEGQKVRVICVLKKNAKSAKKALELANLLNKNYRMVPSDSWDDCIALPVHENALLQEEGPWTEWVKHIAAQFCPYSTAVLGNHQQKPAEPTLDGLSPSQLAIYHTIRKIYKQETLTNDDQLHKIRLLNNLVCPKKLETFGDDRTLVIPPNAFVGEDFESLLQTSEESHPNLGEFWQELAIIHNSNRIARRGTVDPNSKIRESGHRLVWPASGIPETTGKYLGYPNVLFLCVQCRPFC